MLSLSEKLQFLNNMVQMLPSQLINQQGAQIYEIFKPEYLEQFVPILEECLKLIKELQCVDSRKLEIQECFLSLFNNLKAKLIFSQTQFKSRYSSNQEISMLQELQNRLDHFLMAIQANMQEF